MNDISINFMNIVPTFFHSTNCTFCLISVLNLVNELEPREATLNMCQNRSHIEKYILIDSLLIQMILLFLKICQNILFYFIYTFLCFNTEMSEN